MIATGLALVLSLTVLTSTGPADAAPRGLRLLAASEGITAYSYQGFVDIESSLWLAAYGEGHEFRAKRARYADAVTMTHSVITGRQRTIRTVPAPLVDGFNGFKDGLTVTVSNPDGEALYQQTQALCPGGWDRQRVEPSGPQEPIYPSSCWANWLNRPGSDGGSQSMEDESHGSTQEVPRRAA